jgi:hypothetical protein
MKLGLFVAASVLALMGPVNVSAQVKGTNSEAPPFWSDLGSGPFRVGYRVLYLRDHAKPWLSASGTSLPDPGRPIRVSVWYPASHMASSGKMKYGDYLRHEGPTEFEVINNELDKNDQESWLSDLRELSPPGQTTFNELLSTPVAAYLNAPPARGRFPLVLYSGGKASRADDNVELGEYLASHGYVIATVPELGPSSQDIELGSSP